MYIIDKDNQQREAYATRLVMLNPILREPVFTALDLGNLSWFVLEVDTQWTRRKPGDIDVLGGRLGWHNPTDVGLQLQRYQQERPHVHPSWHERFAAMTIAEAGGIIWPPSMDYLAGVEVKCSHCENGVARSTKASSQKVADIRQKIDGLFRLGLDRVVLLDIVAGPPSEGEGSEAWFTAMASARMTLDKVSELLVARLPIDTLAGQLVWPVGAVGGGNEAMRGAGVPRILRLAQENPFRDDVSAKRLALTEHLRNLLTTVAQPTTFPVILLHCRSCKRVHAPAWQCAAS